MRNSRKTLVSAVTTTKEEGKYLRKTLEAIRKQTYRPVEIVVCDSESKDNTASVSREYNAKVVIKKTNISQGRNLAVLNSRGNIIVIFDADTVLSRNWISRAIQDLENKKADMVIGIFRPQERTFAARLTCYLWSDFLPSLLRIFGTKGHATGSTFLMRRSFFDRIGGFNEDLELIEDADFIMRADKKGKIVWDRKLVSKTSMRRFEKDGYLRWYFLWIVNGLHFVFFRKPFQKHYKVIR